MHNRCLLACVSAHRFVAPQLTAPERLAVLKVRGQRELNGNNAERVSRRIVPLLVVMERYERVF
jgi:hypothetical protein